jgi:hypothetical protein
MYEQSMRLRQHEKVEERFNRVKHVHAKAEQHDSPEDDFSHVTILARLAPGGQSFS